MHGTPGHLRDPSICALHGGWIGLGKRLGRKGLVAEPVVAEAAAEKAAAGLTVDHHDVFVRGGGG